MTTNAGDGSAESCKRRDLHGLCENHMRNAGGLSIEEWQNSLDRLILKEMGVGEVSCGTTMALYSHRDST